ncbi:MAG: hypothetical protein ACYCR4_07235 [Acidimicrobiales bacterium]
MTTICRTARRRMLAAALVAALPSGAVIGTGAVIGAGAVIGTASVAGAAPRVHHGPTSWAAKSTAQIKASWRTFFAGSTPAARKIALLEDGRKFSAIIRGQSSSALGRSTSAVVKSVRLVNHTTAVVRYTISLAGKPVLAGATGTAVYQASTWKVGDVSFCKLLALEQVKAPACPVAKG